MTENDTGPALLTTAQAADLVNVGERTLWRWSRSGIAPRPVRIGGTAVRYRRDEYLAWIADGCPCMDEWEGARQFVLNKEQPAAIRPNEG